MVKLRCTDPTRDRRLLNFHDGSFVFSSVQIPSQLVQARDYQFPVLRYRSAATVGQKNIRVKSGMSYNRRGL